MLIRCCFAIIAMVDTMFSASNQSSLKFLPTFGIVHHVLLQHLDFYLDNATLFPAQVWGGIHENFNLLLCIIYLCMCASLFG
jgi:ABC-type polysaccharide/polyol phosphate export permease